MIEWFTSAFSRQLTVIIEIEYQVTRATEIENNHHIGDQLQGSATPSICPGRGKKGHVDHAPVWDRMSIAAWLDHAPKVHTGHPLWRYQK